MIDELERYRRNLAAEVEGAFLYRRLAELEERPELAEVYRRLAATEDRHALFWEERIRAAGGRPPPSEPGLRARLLARLAGWFGPGLLASVMAREEAVGRTMYDDQPEASGTSLPGDERSHARILGLITARGGGVEGPALARLEGRHRLIGGNALRAAVLGATDGLVSNLALVMGVAGAALPRGAVLVAGLAGLLAGAGSMALGEWISVQSSRELYQRELAVEADEIAEFPEEEQEELALIYRAKGIPAPQAEAMAAAIMADPSAALDAMAREELGIDPGELGGSPWTAALASFVLFAAGALVPVLPFVFASGGTAVLAALAAGGVALFLLGAAVSLFTGLGPLRSGLRQTVFGLGAAGVTFAVGRLLGTALGG